ncbi:nucleotidyltransferase family protein [Bacillus pinisoli]|uniref:nucleotidyltransferase domain-containing protein n=1 Tax=Bacillus pinisoli TaxID=2901866 RepID=UPI003AF09D4B
MTMSIRLSLNHVSKEFQLVLDIINDQIIPNKFANIDWMLFTDLIEHHRLFSFIYPKLREKEELVPENILRSLESMYQQNTIRMLHLSGEMSIISSLFTKKNIPLIVLKGPVLAQDLYGDISLRTSSDLDVLVPIKQLECAEEILSKRGYIKNDYIKTVLNDWRWRHHHVTYVHPQKKVKVELHWRLNPGPAKEPSFSELWNRKRVSTITKEPIYILGKEDLFFFLSTHGARHAWSRLRWLLDIRQLLERDLDWNFIYTLFMKNHYIPVGSQAIILSSSIFDTPLPNIDKLLLNKQGEKLAQLVVFYFERMVNLHTVPVPDEVSSYHSKYLFSSFSWQQKCLYLLSLLYPFPEDAETLPLPQKYHFLYFLLRPYLWARRRMFT